MPSEFFASSGITIFSLIFTVLILIQFVVKGKINRIAGKFFLFVVIIMAISMVCNILFFATYYSNSSLYMLMGKIRMFTCITSFHLSCHYVYAAFLPDEEYRIEFKNRKKIYFTLFVITFLINLILTIILPLEIKYGIGDDTVFLSGPVHIYSSIWGISLIVCLLHNFIKYRKNINLHIILLSGLTALFAGVYFISVLFFDVRMNCAAFIQTLVVLFMYMTVESQDAAILAEFQESNKKALESNKLKNEFIMNMSHQLRTPMNTILGFSDILLTTENIAQSELIDNSSSIEIASTRLLELINAVLDISKFESNKEIIKNSDYNLDTILYDVSSHINSRIDKDNLLFNINANENCPNDLYGDGQKIAKILNIVLSNAVKFTDYGEVSLNVSSSLVDKDNHEFTFHIKNSGHLMKVEDFDRSFEDLIKLNSSSNNDIDADTLKIIIAKSLVELLGGSISFINETGKGSQYIIKIKQKVLSDNQLGNIREKIQTKHNVIYNRIDLTGKRVLIIDDQKINMIILQRLLVQYNMEIDVTSNPRDGVDRASNGVYDIIFVNHKMEDMSGLDVIKKLEGTGNKVPPVIGLINGSDEFDLNDGYTFTIECPIEFRNLNKVIKKIFERGQ